MTTRNSTRHGHSFIDLTGQVFGKWTVLGPHSIDKHGTYMWLCRCECGREVSVASAHLRNGDSTQCNRCARRRHGQARTRYGDKASLEWATWSAMLGRTCWRKSIHKANRRYAELGVTVCQRWKTFENFFADMGLKPSPKHSVERIDNEGHYSCGHCKECLANGWPANCRWATPSEQAQNRCDNHLLTYKGQTKCLSEWARQIGIAPCTLYSRLERGWELRKALTTGYSKPPVNMITFQGETKTASEWAAEVGISRSVINARIRRGWPVSKALTTPVKKPSSKYTMS